MQDFATLVGMIPRRIKRALRTLAVGTLPLAVAVSCIAQATVSGSKAPDPSRVDLYGGYAYFHPFSSSINGLAYEPITLGAVSSASYYFNNHLGAQAEGQFSPHGRDDCFYAAQAGPIYRRQYGRFFPFAHALFGGARLGGPQEQSCTWGYGATAGLGVDYVLAPQFLHNHLALRLVQADFEYAHINFGAPSSPTSFDGGEVDLKAWRLSSGIVLRLGDTVPGHPPTFGCQADPVNVYAGDKVQVVGSIINLDPRRKDKTTFTWTTSGGKITGTNENAVVDTAGLAPGDYNIVGHMASGPKGSQLSDCNASFRVHGYDPPTLSCSADPATVLPGGVATITSQGRSPQNRTLNYSYGASAGQITGTGPTGTFSAVDVSPGAINITCNVVDDLGQQASAQTSVTVLVPPAPPPPSARPLCSVSFERDRKRPVRVDNEAKGCLDDIALELNRDSDSTLVIVGKHDPDERPDASAERTMNVREYLIQEKGIDPTRIQVRTGESTGRTADNVLVPPGSTWDPGGTTSFDPTRVQRHGQAYAPNH